MNLDDFLVRRARRLVEKCQTDEAWIELDDMARDELVGEIGPLPSGKRLGTEDAKRFDLLMLQLALLKGSKRFTNLNRQLLNIVEALEAQQNLQAIGNHLALIEEIHGERALPSRCWVSRLRQRDLSQHIEKGRKAVVFSNFADANGEGEAVELPQVGEADFARFKAKARAFLRRHEDHIVLHKVRQGKALTASDLDELEKMLLDAGVGAEGDIERARETSQGFGRFVRSLVGLGRQAVNAAFADFIGDGTASAAQIEFIGMVVDHLTERGAMDPALLYDSPFTDIAPRGPEEMFEEERVVQLVDRIRTMSDSAVA